MPDTSTSIAWTLGSQSARPTAAIRLLIAAWLRSGPEAVTHTEPRHRVLALNHEGSIGQSGVPPHPYIGPFISRPLVPAAGRMADDEGGNLGVEGHPGARPRLPPPLLYATAPMF